MTAKSVACRAERNDNVWLLFSFDLSRGAGRALSHSIVCMTAGSAKAASRSDTTNQLNDDTERPQPAGLPPFDKGGAKFVAMPAAIRHTTSKRMSCRMRARVRLDCAQSHATYTLSGAQTNRRDESALAGPAEFRRCGERRRMTDGCRPAT